MNNPPIPKTISHFTLKQLYYFADDELVEILGELDPEERERIGNHPWSTARIQAALEKLNSKQPRVIDK
jgi:hypothetical protein